MTTKAAGDSAPQAKSQDHAPLLTLVKDSAPAASSSETAANRLAAKPRDRALALMQPGCAFAILAPAEGDGPSVAVTKADLFNHLAGSEPAHYEQRMQVSSDALPDATANEILMAISQGLRNVDANKEAAAKWPGNPLLIAERDRRTKHLSFIAHQKSYTENAYRLVMPKIASMLIRAKALDDAGITGWGEAPNLEFNWG